MPRHIIYIDGSIAQSVPEHPRRDNIFSISSAYGDAYLFQVCYQNCLMRGLVCQTGRIDV